MAYFALGTEGIYGTRSLLAHQLPDGFVETKYVTCWIDKIYTYNGNPNFAKGKVFPF